MTNPFIEQAELQLLHGAWGAALQIARMGLSLFPEDVALLELALTCAVEQRQDALVVAFAEDLLAIDPGAAAAANQLGLALERLGRLDEAEAAYRRALAIVPEDGHLLSNLGLLLESQGHLDEALSCQRAAVALAADSAPVHTNLGSLLARLGQPEAAEVHYRQALALDPGFLKARSNLGVLFADAGRLAEAEACFREVLAIKPDYLQVRMNLGEVLLAGGRLLEGWPFYEGRQHIFVEGGHGPTVNPPLCPQWRGEPLAGRSIVVMPEQGLGDEIQFARFLPWLKAQGAARVTLVCRPQQKALFGTLVGPDCLVDLNEAGPLLPEHDYWVFLMSLPMHAGTDLSTIPPAPYLHADGQRVAQFADYFSAPGMKVGLVWRGNPKHLNDSERSLPGLAVLQPVLNQAGVRFFSLQLGQGPLPADLPVIDLAPLITDFADTAALLQQLDLVISVDSAVAHLAGALGVPCWILLPAYKTDWRWLRGRGDTPWYPQTRLFRQTRRGQWDGVVVQVAEALADQVAGAGKTA